MNESRLDLSKPIGECSTQELLEALMLQRGRFNLFDAERVLHDLYANRNLWISFFMGPQIVEDAEYCLNGLFRTLRSISYRWHADTLYVHAQDDDCVYPLVELGKVWQCDDVEVFDRKRTGELMGRYPAPSPVVVYWWD
ncbi:hypothetical protein [Microseira wollei]|uniref:DUF4253 domain-containing protein n=1 Tax=Microseira wollei NIES-4236 TaxID=2530354 RepID=A0AAV3XEJ1_9CYAN|nr:hypothetical protein [Microseira wollei]GET37827.1 hypothetical protein MiSe_25810 [Microseira wollei NIES-4236]